VTSENTPVRFQIRTAILPLLAMFLASRLVLLVLARVALQLTDAHGHGGSFSALLCRFDCTWYLGIAAHGYSPVETGPFPWQTNFAFYPLFPLLMRALMPLSGGDALHAGILVANLCFVAALVYVYLYVRELGFERNVALLTGLILCVFPQSIVFSAPYTESLCLLLLAAAMYHLRREHYLAAGIAAALLSATRPNAIFFILFAVVWLWQRHGARTLFFPWRAPERFIPIVLAPLGAFVFFGYCYVATGDAFAAPSAHMTGWAWSFVSPWENLPEQLRSGGSLMLAAWVDVAMALCSLLLLRYGMYAEFVFCAATILFVCCGQGVVCVFRYWLVLFPLWIGMARTVSLRPAGAALLCALLGTINGAMVCAWALGMSVAI
jgi:hypothetical protein